jgi:hypothetical protein
MVLSHNERLSTQMTKLHITSGTYTLKVKQSEVMGRESDGRVHCVIFKMMVYKHELNNRAKRESIAEINYGEIIEVPLTISEIKNYFSQEVKTLRTDKDLKTLLGILDGAILTATFGSKETLKSIGRWVAPSTNDIDTSGILLLLTDETQTYSSG